MKKMKNFNTILSLESIPKATIYSKYGESLDRMFKSRSLKSLIYELKNPKKYIPKENQDEDNQKKNIEENQKDIFSTLDENKMSPKNKIKITLKKNPIEPNNKFNPRALKKNVEFMDPFKYNPNYNSISKKVPSVRIILSEKELKELKNIREREKSPKNRKILPNLKIKKIIPKVKTRNEDSFITLLNNNNLFLSKNSEDMHLKSLPPILRVPVKKEKERNLTIENNDYLRNNHALRFSKYVSRKFDFNNKDNIDKISYLEPYDYSNNKNNNNVVDFRKMAFRKDYDFINSSSLGVPSFNEYNPKYNLIDKKSSEVIFAPSPNKKKSKKYLLKKLWSSYEALPEYILVNNNKLMEK